MTGRTAQRVLLQEPRDFTVQLVSLADQRILGTGIIISTEGIVATCAHVVAPRNAKITEAVLQEIGVRFPAWSGRQPSTHTVSLAGSPLVEDDDLLCLRVLDPPILSQHHAAKLGDAEDSASHAFRSYGYRKLAHYTAARTEGIILGTVEAPIGKRLACEPVQLRSQEIDQGMSGSGVLDIHRNLVVGLIAESWYAGSSGKDRDTGWAVNVRVLTFTKLDIPIVTENLPLRASAQPVPEVPPRLGPGSSYIQLDQAPVPLSEWVGRDDLLRSLLEEWQNKNGHLVVSLIGFGGEGKTSIARRVVDTILDNPHYDDFGGVFWWTFSDTAGPDEFLTAALEFMTRSRVLAASVAGSAKIAAAASLLEQRRYLFILDALEFYQYQEGDSYGALSNSDLLAFLRYFATPGHRSACVLTSRAPVFDLLPYVTYRHIDVEALSRQSGRELFRRLGVHGSDAAIDQVVDDWERHALTLSLLAGYLVRRYGGDVRRVSSLPPPDPDEPRDDLVNRLLHQYDSSLTGAERAFLVAFSVFRTPIGPEALALMMPTADRPQSQPARPTETTVDLLDHLLASRLVRSDSSTRFVMHPLIRKHYAHIALQTPDTRQELHTAAKRYYLQVMDHAGNQPSLENLGPAIEAVHHACMAGNYEEAADLVYDHLYHGERGVITRELNAYSTVLAVFQDFFDGQQLHRAPLIQDLETRSWIYHETATALQMVGRLREAATLLQRAMEDFIARELWHEAAVSCQNLTELHLDLGALDTSATLIASAFDLAHRANDPEDELVAQTLRGGLAHLRGQNDEASTAFANALRLAREFTPLPILYSTSGLHYADHLRRSGHPDETRTVHLANLRVCQKAGWKADETRCHVGLGDLSMDDGDTATALSEYEQAYTIARQITRRDALIHALLGRGRAQITGDQSAARADLNQALNMAVGGGYRLVEIDIRIAIARLAAATDSTSAWEAAIHGDQLSIDIGYHWGHLDAQSVISSLR